MGKCSDMGNPYGDLEIHGIALDHGIIIGYRIPNGSLIVWRYLAISLENGMLMDVGCLS